MSRTLAILSFCVIAFMVISFAGTLSSIVSRLNAEPAIPHGLHLLWGLAVAFAVAGAGTALGNGIFLWWGGLGVRPLPPHLALANVIFAVWAFLVFCGEVFTFFVVANNLARHAHLLTDEFEMLVWLAPRIIYALVPLIGVSGVYFYIRRCRPRLAGGPSSTPPTP